MTTRDTDFSVQKAEDGSGFLLWQVTTSWQRGIKKALDDIQITHPQFVLLASLLWLSKQKKNVTQIDLSQHSQIDQMTTSMVIRTLQKKGFIERQEHPVDTRAKIVMLTDSGEIIVKKAVKIIEAFDADFFKPLGEKTQKFNKSLLTLLYK